MLFFLMHSWGHIVSAEPVSACSSCVTKNKGVDQKREEVTKVSPSQKGARTPGETDIWTGTPETSPETEPPQEKRAKREAGQEEPEEGEIVDSDDEEEEEEEGIGVDTSCVKSCDGAKSSANELIKDEPAHS